MTEIRELDPDTIDRIAAGEVVERPAAALKELVENSIDAGADSVAVTLEAGGTDLLRVRDDGHGMTEADVRAAVREHTTSKITELADLERVGTLGFRGEALHAIGAVSRTTITTRAADEPKGTELTLEGGEVTDVSPAGRPVGTTVTVEDLFYNVPARRKYLAADATEFAHCNRVVSRYALANPDVAVSLTHDGREVFSTPGRGDLREAAMAVYGREVAESLVEIEAEAEADDGALADGPVTGVHGLVSHPETTRSTREYLATYVNGRAVEERGLREAILAGYGGQLAADRFPFAVVFVELPPDAVDANVHPRKLEVRFADPGAVHEAVEATVRAGLLAAGILRSGAPRGASAPDEASVAPAPSSNGGGEAGENGANAADGASAGDEVDAAPSTEAAAPSASEAPSESESESTAQSRTAPQDATTSAAGDADSTSAGGADAGRSPRDSSGTGGGSAAETSPSVSSGDPADGAGRAVDSTRTRSARDRGGTGDRPAPGETEGEQCAAAAADATDTAAATGADDAAGATPAVAEPGDRSPDVPGDRKFRPPTQNATLDALGAAGAAGSGAGDAAAAGAGQRSAGGRGSAGDSAEGPERLPALEVLGQLDDTYVVAATGDGLVLIDQHAADERVHYERLTAAADGERASQRLVEPVELSVTAGEAAVFEAALPALRSAGFEARLHGGSADGAAGPTVVVEAVPAVFAEALSPERLRDALAELLADEAGADALDAAADALLSDLACHPAVTGNTSLTEGSVVALLEALDACENPWACPHGRPTIVEIDGDEIADRFERDYPGHQVRRPE